MTDICIEPGSRVTLHYTITLEDGTEADSTRGDQPLTFTVGDGTLLTALENVLLGLRSGEQGLFLLDPEQGFGYRDTDNMHHLPRDDFDPEMALEPGVVIGFTTPGGDEVPGMVLEVNEAAVLVDFNHPLAGHNLHFAVEVLAVESPQD